LCQPFFQLYQHFSEKEAVMYPSQFVPLLAARRTDVLVSSLFLWLAAPAWSVEPWPAIRPAVGPAEERILEELKKPTQFSYINTPLEDALNAIESRHGFEILLDRKALEEEGIGTDTPVNLELEGVTLRSALQLMLRDLDLTYGVGDEVLLITTPEAASRHKVVAIYNVANLLEDQTTAGELLELLHGALGDESAALAVIAEGRRRDRALDRGEVDAAERRVRALGPTPVEQGQTKFFFFRQLLVVRASETKQHEVAEFLSALHTALEANPTAKQPVP
jgi:hypothetical protein